MNKFSDMQKVFEALKQNFNPMNDSNYKAFITFGLDPKHIAKNVCVALPSQEVTNLQNVMRKASQFAQKSDISFTSHSDGGSKDDPEWTHFKSHPNNTVFGNADIKYRVYVPIKSEASQSFVVNEVLKNLVKSGISFSGKYANTYRNDSLTIEVGNQEDLVAVQNLFTNSKELTESLGQHNPFIPDKNGLGIVDLTYDATKVSYSSETAKIFQNFFLEFCKGKDGIFKLDKVKNTRFQDFIDFAKTDGSKLTKEKGALSQLYNEIIETQQRDKNQTQNKSTQSTQTTNKSNLPDPTLYPQYDFSFAGLKKTYETYDLVKQEKTEKEVLVAKDKKTGEIITDPLIIDRTKFSKQWVASFRDSELSLPSPFITDNPTVNDKFITERYAWNPNAENDYNNLMSAIQMQLNGNGNVSAKEAVEFLKTTKTPGIHQTNFAHFFNKDIHSQSTTNYCRHATPEAKPQTKMTSYLTVNGQEKFAD